MHGLMEPPLITCKALFDYMDGMRATFLLSFSLFPLYLYFELFISKQKLGLNLHTRIQLYRKKRTYVYLNIYLMLIFGES